ncbi:hypothetical protein ABVN80_15840 [Acinetobacter baumannii]
MQSFERIIYISCNPNTLYENLKATHSNSVKRY